MYEPEVDHELPRRSRKRTVIWIHLFIHFLIKFNFNFFKTDLWPCQLHPIEEGDVNWRHLIAPGAYRVSFQPSYPTDAMGRALWWAQSSTALLFFIFSGLLLRLGINHRFFFCQLKQFHSSSFAWTCFWKFQNVQTLRWVRCRSVLPFSVRLAAG